MTRLLWIAIASLACACGDSGSAGIDATGGSDDGSGNDDGGGGDDGGTDALSAGLHTIAVTLKNRPNNGANYSFVVGYQDGSAPWKLAPAPTGDTYSFDVTAPSWGVMYACIGPAGSTSLRTVNIAHFAIAERTSLTLDVPQRCSDRVPNLVTLAGQVTNRPSTGVVMVQYGTRSATASTLTGVFAMQVPVGTSDLLVLHAVPEGNGNYYVDQAVTVRDFKVTGPASKAIDFSAAQATTVYNVNASVSNASVVASTQLYTANGTQVTTTREITGWESDALPAALRRPTDVYDQSIAVSTLGRGVTVTRATSTPGDQTYVAPDALGNVTSSLLTGQPYPRVRASWPEYPGAVGYVWTASQTSTSGPVPATVAWTSYLSPGVTGMAPSYTMPDLSALAGWKPQYALANASTSGSVTAIRSSAGASDFPTGIPAAGTSRVFVRTDFVAAP